MGQQQLLLLILAVIIVAVAIAIGITIFNGWSINSNKDALMADINNISSLAYGYYSKAKIMGGGSGTYVGFDISDNLQSNADGDISWVISADGKTMTFTATSRYGFGTVSSILDDRGDLTSFVFSGDF